MRPQHIKKIALNSVELLLLLVFILLVHFPILAYDLMYPEQPLMYMVNQGVSSWWDLFKIYLHPQMLNFYIPFFRPSGHFLMYQLLSPLLGWHNTQAYLVVNYIFLAIAGWTFIKLYKLLFPGFLWGGYVGFAFYLMHPALSLSRFTILHFEFAYVCFSLISIYCFILFCHKNLCTNRLAQMRWLYASLVSYIVAITFKESALMVGPILFIYFGFFIQQKYSLHKPMQTLKQHKELGQVLALISVISLSSIIYLSLQWSQLLHPSRAQFHWQDFYGPFFYFINHILGININLNISLSVPGPLMPWREINFPFLIRPLIVTLLSLSTCICIYLLTANKMKSLRPSIYFVGIMIGLFSLLPLLWAMGLPWHYSLTLLCMGFLVGLSFEFICIQISGHLKVTKGVCILMAALIGLCAIPVNYSNIHRYEIQFPNTFLGMTLVRNALHSPPNLALQADTLLVVEDSILKNQHLLGNGFYPFLVYKDIQSALFRQNLTMFYQQFDPLYSGTMFRWSFLRPSLKEELYPFEVENMQNVPTAIIYHWLRHEKSLQCVGYNATGNWQNKTYTFKQNLTLEKMSRRLKVYDYQVHAKNFVTGEQFHVANLIYEDPELCEYMCDQSAECGGFNYVKVKSKALGFFQCRFHRPANTGTVKPCEFCTSYIKKSVVA